MISLTAKDTAYQSHPKKIMRMREDRHLGKEYKTQNSGSFKMIYGDSKL